MVCNGDTGNAITGSSQIQTLDTQSKGKSPNSLISLEVGLVGVIEPASILHRDLVALLRAVNTVAGAKKLLGEFSGHDYE
jgi:hypothetical protein